MNLTEDPPPLSAAGYAIVPGQEVSLQEDRSTMK